MFQVVFKGAFEVEDAEKFIQEVDRVIDELKGSKVGQFQIYQLAPYVDYQKCDVKDTETGDSNI